MIGQLFKRQFRPGDVIYGLNTPRTWYWQQLPVALTSMCFTDGLFTTVDDYNNATFGAYAFTPGAHPVIDPNYQPSHEATIKGNAQYHFATGVLNFPQWQSSSHFYSSLLDSHRSPIAAVDLPWSPDKAKLNRNDHTNLVFRRACKFGLEYFLTMVPDSRVHFVLDRRAHAGTTIDMAEVVSKTTQSDGYVSITHSELRCCYRNRHKWGATGRLKFYRDLAEVDAPWNADPNLWQQYDQHRAAKYSTT